MRLSLQPEYLGVLSIELTFLPEVCRDSSDNRTQAVCRQGFAVDRKPNTGPKILGTPRGFAGHAKTPGKTSGLIAPELFKKVTFFRFAPLPPAAVSTANSSVPRRVRFLTARLGPRILFGYASIRTGGRVRHGKAEWREGPTAWAAGRLDKCPPPVAPWVGDAARCGDGGARSRPRRAPGAEGGGLPPSDRPGAFDGDCPP